VTEASFDDCEILPNSQELPRQHRATEVERRCQPDGRCSKVDDVDDHSVFLQQFHQAFNRLDPRLDAVGIKDDVRHLGRQMLGKNSSQAGGSVDRQRAVMRAIEAALEQKHLHEIGVSQDGNCAIAVRQLHHVKPRRVVAADDKARKGELEGRRHLDGPYSKCRGGAYFTPEHRNGARCGNSRDTGRAAYESIRRSFIECSFCRRILLPLWLPTGLLMLTALIAALAQLKRTPMNASALTTERIVALVIVALNVLAAAFFSTVSPNPGLVAMAAFGLSIPGLAMIWFRDALSVTGFDRGVLRDSPPIFIDVIGWLFLVILPVIFLYKLLP
jgi:hypothetical protein